jgi:hypothetical protein
MRVKNILIEYFLKVMLISAWLFIFSHKCSAEEPAVIINELMWMGSSSSIADEWIELKNISGSTVDFKLTPWSIYKNDSLMLVVDKGAVNSGKYFLVSNNPENYKFTNGQSILNIKPDFINTDISLSNTSAQYKLYDAPDNSGSLIDVADDGSGTPLAGENGAVKKSMERNADFSDGTIASSWHTCYKPENLDDGSADCGTPGAQNSEEEKPEPVVYADEIIINEILPNPSGDEENEFIELYNPGDENVDLSGWTLKDAGKTSHYIFHSDTIIKSGGYLVIYRKDFKFALNNSGDESVYLMDPNGEEVSKIFYDKANEGVSYNFDGNTWRWSRFITPGEDNKFNNLPDSKTKKDKKIFVGVYADFKAEAKDKNKDQLKFTWDFGDGHKSYKKETRHKYEKAGKYEVKLKIFDGSEEKIETFKIEVKKFPRDKVKIRSLCPNPEGSDSKNEWLSIKNYSDEEINLKGWGIATGYKKLYNHPINEDFEIKAGGERIISRKYANFSLNNEKSKVELRYPDGKTAYKVKYDKGDEKAHQENEVYERTDEGWQWLKTQTDTDLTQTNADEEQADSDIILTDANTTQTDAEEVEEEDFSEFIGGQSADDSEKIDKKELLNLGTNVRLASLDYSGGGKVLGISIEKNSPPVYKFTENRPKENGILKIVKKTATDVNLLLNKTINLIIATL